jgi:hypothetical protein
MPLIKPRTRGKQVVRRIVRLDRETNETLWAYAHFLGESPDYVLNEVIDSVLARDKEFQAWRVAHPDSFVPVPPAGASVRRRRGKRREAAPGSGLDATHAPVVVRT